MREEEQGVRSSLPSILSLPACHQAALAVTLWGAGLVRAAGWAGGREEGGGTRRVEKNLMLARGEVREELGAR